MPRWSMNLREKLAVAQQLGALKVDVSRLASR